MADIPKWHVQGDWFDTCNCSIPCPCTFAQPPTSGDCEGILAWHIRKGDYGDVRLDGLNVMALGIFKGNIWEGQTKASMAMFIDERADERQREALQMISADASAAGQGHSRISSARCAAWSSLASTSTSTMTWHRGGPRFPAS